MSLRATCPTLTPPNYKPRELSFEKELQTALGQNMEGQMSRTSVEHIPSTFDSANFRPEWSEAFKPRLIHGEDRVNLDKEMAKHSKNQLQFTALAQILTKTFEGMHTVIRDGKQA